MKSLLEFYNDKEAMANVQAYLIEYLEKEALQKVFNKEDVTGIADAKAAIEGAFDNLDAMFAPKVKPKTGNEAR